MFHPRLFLVLCCVLPLCACAPTARTIDAQLLAGAGTEAVIAPRVSIDLNSGWKFVRQEQPGAERPEFDDSSWDAVSLPHTWNNMDGEDGGNDYYRGSAWYRRHLALNGDLKGKSLFLKFYGASSATTVFVNGQQAGPEHKGMFSAFCYDVTPLLNPAGDNLIAVRVTNAPDKTIPPLEGDFTLFGGIYRGVQLLATNPLSITPLDDASPGVYIKQKNVTDDHADLQVTSLLRNSEATDQTITVTTDLFDASGKSIQNTSLTTLISAGASAQTDQVLSIDHPRLWDGKRDAYLYHVRVSISEGNSVVDNVLQPVGLRYFRVDPDKGFFLNGQPYPLHGVNRHQDRQDMGWAITSAEQKEDFNLIAEMGCNTIRLGHYQQAQDFYDLCDRGGMVVWAEASLINVVDQNPLFDEIVRQQLRELIKQSFNHPSICFWSLFNELNAPKGMSGNALHNQLQHQVTLVSGLNQLAHDLDSTRLTAAASNAPFDSPLNAMTDVIGFNRYDGWYWNAPNGWSGGLDELHSRFPRRGIAISEYGAGASANEHEANPSQPKTTSEWHPEEWQGIVHESAYGAMKNRPWLWGTFVWTMFDIASDSRHEGDHLGINDKGLVTYDRKTKKDTFFFYKANWSAQPVLYITDRRFTPRNVAATQVKIYSNCDSVDLKLNGQSLGEFAAPDHVFLWPDVTLRRGKNLLEASGSYKGQITSDSCTIDFDPGVIDLRPLQPATKPTTR